MPDEIFQQKIFPYDGAFDATKHPLLISPKDVVDSQNIVYTTYSTKKLRPGISHALDKRYPSKRKILRGIDFWRLGQQFVVFYNGKEIIAYDVSARTYEVISNNFDVPVDAVVHFLAFQGLLIVTFEGNTTPPKGWLGAGPLVDLSPTASLYNAPFCRVWLNKLWMPDPSVPGRLLHSNTGTVDFTGGDAGNIDLDPNDEDPDGLTAIFPPFFSSLYVTKRFSTYQIKPLYFGTTLVFSESKISDGVGCVSHGGVAAGPGNIFFPSDEGVHYFVSSDKVSEIDSEDFSIQIQPLWNEQTNFKRARYMQGVYDRTLKSYILVYPSDSSLYPNDAWGYSVVAKKWYRWRDYNQTSVFRFVNPKTKKLQTMVGSKKGDLGVIDASVDTDYGVPFNCSLQSGIICPGGVPNDDFAFNCIAPIFVPKFSGSFTISLKINGTFIQTLIFDQEASIEGGNLGEDFVLGVSTLGSIPQMVCDVRSIKGYGMMYEFLIEYTGVADGMGGFELLGIITDVDKTSKVTGRTGA